MKTTVEKYIESLVRSKYKNISVSEDKLIEYTHTKQDPWPIRLIKSDLDVKILRINGFNCFVVKSKKVKPSNKRIVYIHGGAYISEIHQVHWLYIKALIKETNAIVYLPIYPLTTNTYSGQIDTIKFLTNLYKEITTKEPQCVYSLMGDSAGGNLALVLAQQIKVQKFLKPRNVILLSPVVSMEITPEANKIAHNDSILSYSLLTTVLKWQLRDQSPHNPLFSPMYGDNVDIGDIYFFMGEKEIFTYQINQFLKLLDKQGVKYFIDIKKDMYHAYAIFDFTKHAKDANKKIIEILNKD